jgi:Protein of unknown function (DUF3551)
MQRVSQTLMALGVVMAATGAPAVAGGMPYCIKGCDFGGGAGDCSFSSLAQCQATASGRDATCAANPYLNARAEISKPEISKAEMPANPTHLSRRKL